jgi:hypothetical protein
LGGEGKKAKLEYRLIVLGMAAFPCCTDETRRPGMQARRSVASLAALPPVCFGPRDDARRLRLSFFHIGRPEGAQPTLSAEDR